ncbi:BQ2448_7548 [Microbotryum intermedium]|uniref:BQ2448_7548 protein n=1 Tax=Microbotryum intermedium TaxID=269621 RepID=A0A238FP20_9BASI|nr:BQ2448_7548 [Microbotryum intermedium]
MCKALNTDLILFLSPSEQGSTPSKLLVSSLSTSFQQLEMGLQGFGEKNWSKSIWTIHGGVEGLGRLFGF